MKAGKIGHSRKTAGRNTTTRSRYIYHAYKLRMWQQDAPGGWWGCLQNTTTGKYTFFKTLDDLFMYLNLRFAAYRVRSSAVWSQPGAPAGPEQRGNAQSCVRLTGKQTNPIQFHKFSPIP